MSAVLLTALLSMFTSVAHRPCIERQRDEIAWRADSASAKYGVPPGLLITVAFLESHLGCANGSGGCWGAPSSRAHRDRAGNAFHAARALAAGYRVCHNWHGAVQRFRTGLCGVEPRHGYTAAFAMRMTRRLYDTAGLAMPESPRTTIIARRR